MLNIDKLIGEKKKIVFGGKEYEVQEPTLETVIAADKLLKGEGGEDKLLTDMAQLIKELVPGLDLNAVPVRVMLPMLNYIISGDENQEEGKNTDAPAKEVTNPT